MPWGRGRRCAAREDHAGAVLCADGSGSSTAVSAGITWAVQPRSKHREPFAGARRGANHGPLLRSPAVDGAIKAAAASGVVVVVAAGNTSTGGANGRRTTPRFRCDRRRASRYRAYGRGTASMSLRQAEEAAPIRRRTDAHKKSIVSTWWNPQRSIELRWRLRSSMSVAFVSASLPSARRGYDTLQP